MDKIKTFFKENKLVAIYLGALIALIVIVKLVKGKSSKKRF